LETDQCLRLWHTVDLCTVIKEEEEAAAAAASSMKSKLLDI
jgi:hypothetical protein